MNTQQCEKCAKFLSKSDDHFCRPLGIPSAYHHTSQHECDTETFALTVDRARSLLTLTDETIYARQLQEMARESGCMQSVPLASLKKFAELVRADMMAAQLSKNYPIYLDT